MLAGLPHHRQCTNLHQSSYMHQNQYHARYPHNLQYIPHREEVYAKIYIRAGSGQVQQVELRKCYRLGRVVCRAEISSALESALGVGRVEVQVFLCVSSVSSDSFRSHSGNERSRTFCFDQALRGVIVLQPSTFFAQETQHRASSLLEPQCMVPS